LRLPLRQLPAYINVELTDGIDDQNEAQDDGYGGEKAVRLGHNIPSLFFLLLTQSHNISSNRISPDSVPLIDYFLSVEIFRMYNIAWAHNERNVVLGHTPSVFQYDKGQDKASCSPASLQMMPSKTNDIFCNSERCSPPPPMRALFSWPNHQTIISSL